MTLNVEPNRSLIMVSPLMKMDLRIRIAKNEDHSFLHTLSRLAFEEVVTKQFGVWDDIAQPTRFESKIQKALFRIVEINNRPIAAVWSAEENDHIYLHELLVHPDFQNMGIGSHILSLEVEKARFSKKPIRLHTLVLNRAQELYKRHGFKETGRNDIYVYMEKKG